MSDSIEIRTLTSVEDCRRVQVVQDLVWGGGHGDTMSIHVLVTQTKSGGLLQAAFVERGAEDTDGMIGFSFGWPAFGYGSAGERKLKFCSHIMGVLPAWHGRGIGLRLKLSQREELLRQGWTDWVTWTFDPLQRVNGRLNVSRLGGISTTYLRNVYGEMTDSLNAGMPTDRFQVDWYSGQPARTKCHQRRPPDPGMADRVSTARTYPFPRQRPAAGPLTAIRPHRMAAPTHCPCRTTSTICAAPEAHCSLIGASSCARPPRAAWPPATRWRVAH